MGKTRPASNRKTKATVKPKQIRLNKKTHKTSDHKHLDKLVTFIKNHKKSSIIFTFCIFLIIIAIFYFSFSIEINESRTEFSCNLEYVRLENNTDKTLRCKPIEINGTFTSRAGLTLTDNQYYSDDFWTEDDKWHATIQYEFKKYYNFVNDFDINRYDSIDRSIYLYLRTNNWKNVFGKYFKFKFVLSEDDKKLLAEVVNEWRPELEQKKAEEEARERAEAEQRKAEEEQKRIEEEQRRVEEERKAAEEKAAKEAAEKSTFPNSEMSTAMDICTDQFYYSKGISIVPALKNWKNSFWSGNDFVQTINIADGKIRIVCQYNWKEKTATITDWSYL